MTSIYILMKKLTKIFSFTFLFLSVTAIAVAGNEDRAGEEVQVLEEQTLLL